jgi:hypothetical protein
MQDESCANRWKLGCDNPEDQNRTETNDHDSSARSHGHGRDAEHPTFNIQHPTSNRPANSPIAQTVR